jgi:hypothetical protein
VEEIDGRFTDDRFVPGDGSPLEAVPGVFDLTADCKVRYPAFGVSVMAPACDRMIQALALSDRAPYVAELDRLLAGPFVLETLYGWLDAWQAQIEPATAEDTRGPGLDELRSAVAVLLSSLPVLRERALAERAAAAASSAP